MARSFFVGLDGGQGGTEAGGSPLRAGMTVFRVVRYGVFVR